MTAPTGSYRKVFYDLRPAKQVERRMLVDAMQRLQVLGFSISDYQYTGLGSVGFVDFILFHRWLGIRDLLSVEHDARIKKRVEFNRPFGPVKVQIDSVGNVLSSLDQDRRHLVWLDYDDHLGDVIAQDMVLAASRLAIGSVVLATIDAEPTHDSPSDELARYDDLVGAHLDAGWNATAFTKTNLATTLAQLLTRIFLFGVSPRPHVRWQPLFSFEYADGHAMVTVGGMIVGDAEARQLAPQAFAGLPFIRLEVAASPFRIGIPRLTRRERLYLDQHMPCPSGWSPKDFELLREEIDDYREIYRYYPTYAELMV